MPAAKYYEIFLKNFFPNTYMSTGQLGWDARMFWIWYKLYYIDTMVDQNLSLWSNPPWFDLLYLLLSEHLLLLFNQHLEGKQLRFCILIFMSTFMATKLMIFITYFSVRFWGIPPKDRLRFNCRLTFQNRTMSSHVDMHRCLSQLMMIKQWGW